MSAYISFNKSQPVDDGESTAAPSINVGDVTKPALVDMELLKPNKELHQIYRLHRYLARFFQVYSITVVPIGAVMGIVSR